MHPPLESPGSLCRNAATRRRTRRYRSPPGRGKGRLGRQQDAPLRRSTAGAPCEPLIRVASRECLRGRIEKQLHRIVARLAVDVDRAGEAPAPDRRKATSNRPANFAAWKSESPRRCADVPARSGRARSPTSTSAMPGWPRNSSATRRASADRRRPRRRARTGGRPGPRPGSAARSRCSPSSASRTASRPASRSTRLG